MCSECFGVQDAEHKVMLQKAKDEVLAFMMNFKAVIKVRVISAERLNIREEGTVSTSVYFVPGNLLVSTLKCWLT